MRNQDDNLETMGGVFSCWKRIKRSKIALSIARKIGHILGVYTVDEYMDLGRIITQETGIKRMILQIKQRKIGNIRGLCIENWNNIGENLHLPHGQNIIINNNAIVGNNCTIYQGVTIGFVESGKHKGAPIVMDDCTIGPNVVIVGGHKIGRNTIIAGNSFVNFDVPPNSVVIGNPGRIHRKPDISSE